MIALYVDNFDSIDFKEGENGLRNANFYQNGLISSTLLHF